MKAHTIKMSKIYGKAVRDGGDHPNEPEKCDDKNNESEMSEDVDNPTCPRDSCGWSLPPGGSAWRLPPLTTLPWVTIIIIIIMYN